MPSQQQTSNTPLANRDSWQTPQWLFDWAHSRYRFDVDLAASEQNKKLSRAFTKEVNALSWRWLDQGVSGWCNPPYSHVGKWLAKGWEEAQKGFRSVFLVNAPNGESYWQKYVFGKASEIIFINGRVAFELPDDDGTAKAQKGNTRGSCLVVFNRTYEAGTLMSWVDRDKLIAEYKK